MAIKSISNDKVYRRGNIKYIYIGYIDPIAKLVYGAERKIQFHFDNWAYSVWGTNYFEGYVLDQMTRSGQSKDSISVARHKTIKAIFY